jgi:hypothetical protein
VTDVGAEATLAALTLGLHLVESLLAAVEVTLSILFLPVAIKLVLG